MSVGGLGDERIGWLDNCMRMTYPCEQLESWRCNGAGPVQGAPTKRNRAFLSYLSKLVESNPSKAGWSVILTTREEPLIIAETDIVDFRKETN